MTREVVYLTFTHPGDDCVAADLLRRVAARVENDSLREVPEDGWSVRDLNGNTVGCLTVAVEPD